MKEFSLSATQNIVDELEFLEGDIRNSRDLFEIIYQEINKDNPTFEEAVYVYKRLQVLNAIFMDRINEETKLLSNLFTKLHNAVYANYAKH